MIITKYISVLTLLIGQGRVLTDFGKIRRRKWVRRNSRGNSNRLKSNHLKIGNQVLIVIVLHVNVF